MSASYTSTRKAYEPWKKNNAGKIEAQRTSAHSQGHSQVWIKKTVQLNLDEIDQCKEEGCHVASQV